MVRQRSETNGAPNPRRRVAKASELFEQQIHRVYELLQRFEADVTWNDHVVDPDQPERARNRPQHRVKSVELLSWPVVGETARRGRRCHARNRGPHSNAFSD